MTDNINKVNPDQVIAKAEKELAEELAKEQINKLKRKMKERHNARIILNNLDREIEDLKLEIAHALGE